MHNKKILSPAGLNLIKRILQQYSQSEQPINAFLTQVLSESNAYASPQEIDKTVSDISITIDTISLAYQDIQDYKTRGLSTGIWLRDNLDKVIHDLPQTEQDAVIESLKSVMNRGNNDLFNSLTDTETDANLVDKLTGNSFSDLNKTAIANNFKEEIKTNTLLNALAFAGTESQDNSNENCSAAQAYFASPLNDPADDNFRKVVTAALEIAKKQNLLNEDLTDTSTVQMAAMVDSGTSSAKAAYKVAQGEVPVIDALDYAIDRSAARVSAVIQVTCQIAGAAVGTLIGGAVGGVLGELGMRMGAEIGRDIGSTAGAKVGELIAQGMRHVAAAAKTTIREVIAVGKSVVGKLVSWLN